MAAGPSKAEAILDAAERMIRTGGYNGFSFREVAKAVGIKAASVHYHYPGKAELGAAVAQRYTDRFIDALGDPETPGIDGRAQLRRFVGAYRASLTEDRLMCLCGMFGAEVEALPGSVAEETRRFFERNIEWLVHVLRRHSAQASAALLRRRARHVVATLEGALILSRTLGGSEPFDDATGSLVDDSLRDL